MTKNEQLAPTQGQIVDIDWSKLVSSKAPDSSFPVDFEYLWPFLGYNQKSDATKALKARFLEGEDFSGTFLKKNGKSKGRPTLVIWLTEGCAKEFCMLASTSQGKAVRRYFIARERQAKKLEAKRSKKLEDAAAREERLMARERRLMAKLLLDVAADAQNDTVKAQLQHRAVVMATGEEMPAMLPEGKAEDAKHLGAADSAAEIGLMGPSGKPNANTFGKTAKLLGLQEDDAVDAGLVSCRMDMIKTPGGGKEKARFFYGKEARERVRAELVKLGKLPS